MFWYIIPWTFLIFLFSLLQIGTKGRSEKIRTYNFAQDRITDHRIGLTLYDIKNFMLGEDLLEEMNSSLHELSNQETLLELLEENNQEGSWVSALRNMNFDGMRTSCYKQRLI